MNKEVQELFNNIVNSNEDSAWESFEAAIDSKLSDALDVKRVAVTADVFNATEEE